MQIHCKKTMNLNKITHSGRAVLRFCSSAYPRSTWYILKTLRFLTICQKHVMTQTLNIANSTALLPALWTCIHPPHMVWGVRTLLHKATFYTEAFTQDFFKYRATSTRRSFHQNHSPESLQWTCALISAGAKWSSMWASSDSSSKS